jgi:hypothetical protein
MEITNFLSGKIELSAFLIKRMEDCNIVELK